MDISTLLPIRSSSLTVRGGTIRFPARRAASPGPRSYKVPGFCRADAASTKLVVSIPMQEQQNDLQNVRAKAVSQLSRRARTQQLAQDQAQVERAHMNQLPLQDVVPSP